MFFYFYYFFPGVRNLNFFKRKCHNPHPMPDSVTIPSGLSFFGASCYVLGAIESQVVFSLTRFQIDTVSRFRKRVENDVISRSQIDQFWIRQGFRRHRVNKGVTAFKGSRSQVKPRSCKRVSQFLSWKFSVFRGIPHNSNNNNRFIYPLLKINK